MHVRTAMTMFLLLGTSASRSLAAGAEVDPTTLYDLKTDESSEKIKAGSKGTFVLVIKTKNGSHVSDETPLKLELSGERLKLEKQKLTYADSVTRKSALARYPDPRFEVSFTSDTPGKTAVDAHLTFFICTEQVCARQVKKMHIPVSVD